MDVVKKAIDKLKGRVEIFSKSEQGSTFIIRLPLTLAIAPSLIVGCRGRRFAVPRANISELVRIKNDVAVGGVERLNDAEVPA